MSSANGSLRHHRGWFIGPDHVDAMRRLGFVEVVAICASRLDSARKKAGALHIPKAYGSYVELLDDPEIKVVDIATPTHLHNPFTMAAPARRKYVIVDKPLAVSSSGYCQVKQNLALLDTIY